VYDYGQRAADYRLAHEGNECPENGAWQHLCGKVEGPDPLQHCRRVMAVCVAVFRPTDLASVGDNQTRYRDGRWHDGAKGSQRCGGWGAARGPVRNIRHESEVAECSGDDATRGFTLDRGACHATLQAAGSQARTPVKGSRTGKKAGLLCYWRRAERLCAGEYPLHGALWHCPVGWEIMARLYLRHLLCVSCLYSDCSRRTSAFEELLRF